MPLKGKARRRTALEEPFKALQELCSLAPKWGPLQGVPILGPLCPLGKGKGPINWAKDEASPHTHVCVAVPNYWKGLEGPFQ